jgi:chorismate mutase
MKQKYLIIDTTILPDCYEKVVFARELVESGKAKDISEAVKTAGISRSTYYKYKDYIFSPGKANALAKKAVVTFFLHHKTGALSQVLALVSENKGNILTINQTLPIGNKAHITLSLEISHLLVDPNELVTKLDALSGVSGTKLIAIE